MRNPRRSTLVIVTAAAWAVCWTQTGCVTLFPHSSSSSPLKDKAARADAPTVLRGTPLAWAIMAKGQPRQGMTGQGVVGDNGALEMGPYGSVHVAGLTVRKAESAIEKQLRHYLRDPKVQLRTVSAQAVIAPPAVPAMQAVTRWSSDEAEGPTAATAWRPASTAAPVRLVSSAGEPLLDGPMLSVGDEPPLRKDMGPPAKRKGPTGKAPEDIPMPRPLPAAPPFAVPAVILHGPGDGTGLPVPTEGHRVTLPPYVIGPPDILQIESLGLTTQPVTGPHLVRPDGTVSLGIYGQIYVAGLTIDQVREAVARAIVPRLKKGEGFTVAKVLENVSVDVLAYNSKVYYVISDGGGYGEQVTRLPITGSETVLDAVGLNAVRTGLYGLPAVASKHHIWVARPGPHGKEQILPVDWIGITQHAQATTNYQILPGDRVYVKADKWRTFNATVDKIVAPFERMLGVTLLGSETVNSIRSGGAVVP